MNIKSLLIGSAAALAAVSGAKAADAIVAAEPEPLEYVRVCDAFGTGFFYIPGTETCLKFSGYVRFQTDFNRGNTVAASGATNGRTSDWNSFTRAQFNVDTKTDTELGAVRGFIELRGDAQNQSSNGLNIQQAFIELGGLKVGKFYNWWDDSLSGETDSLNTFALFNSIRYTYDAGSFWAGVSVDELEGTNTSFLNLTDVAVSGTGLVGTFTREADNNVGVSAGVGATLGGAKFQLIGGYDFDQEEGAARLIATAEIGPGTLGLSGVYSSGINAYYAEAEWALAAEYALKATDRLTITPGAQYSWNVAAKGTLAEAGFLTGTGNSTVNGDTLSGADARAVYYLNNDWTSSNEWRAGVTVDYKITDGLTAKVAATYIDNDLRDDQVSGFVRLQRTF